jgi:hypothetical protein
MNAAVVNEMPLLPPPTELPPMPSPTRSGPRFSRSIDFAALPSAISCTRLFVASTLGRWGARFLEADAEVLAVELVRHSVQTCGVTDEDVRLSELDELNVIHVRLLGFERTIGIEVWDNADGLGLVDTRAKGWGSSITPQGRVVWAELDVYDRAASGLPIRARKPTPYPRPSANEIGHPSQGAGFLRRVRDGLVNL